MVGRWGGGVNNTISSPIIIHISKFKGVCYLRIFYIHPPASLVTSFLFVTTFNSIHLPSQWRVFWVFFWHDFHQYSPPISVTSFLFLTWLSIVFTSHLSDEFSFSDMTFNSIHLPSQWRVVFFFWHDFQQYSPPISVTSCCFFLWHDFQQYSPPISVTSFCFFSDMTFNSIHLPVILNNYQHIAEATEHIIEPANWPLCSSNSQ